MTTRSQMADCSNCTKDSAGNHAAGCPVAEPTRIGVADVAALSGDCPWHAYGQHSWLPWLEVNPGSWVTRCVRCDRTEQWDRSP